MCAASCHYFYRHTAETHSFSFCNVVRAVEHITLARFFHVPAIAAICRNIANIQKRQMNNALINFCVHLIKLNAVCVCVYFFVN